MKIRMPWTPLLCKVSTSTMHHTMFFNVHHSPLCRLPLPVERVSWSRSHFNSRAPTRTSLSLSPTVTVERFNSRVDGSVAGSSESNLGLGVVLLICENSMAAVAEFRRWKRLFLFGGPSSLVGPPDVPLVLGWFWCSCDLSSKRIVLDGAGLLSVQWVDGMIIVAFVSLGLMMRELKSLMLGEKILPRGVVILRLAKSAGVWLKRRSAGGQTNGVLGIGCAG